MKHRVKYYPSNGLAMNMMFKSGVEILDCDSSCKDINDCIEVFNIWRYFEVGTRYKDWDEVQFERYNNKINSLVKDVYKYFNWIDDSNFCQIVKVLDKNYLDDFWSLFEKNKCYEKVSNSCFEKLLHDSDIYLRGILKYRKIVNAYDTILKHALLSSEDFAEVLLDRFSNLPKKNNINIPNSITDEEIEQAITRYINSPQPSLNYLERIYQLQPFSNFSLSDKIKLMAKRKAKELETEILENGFVISANTSIIFQRQEEPTKWGTHDLSVTISHDKTWLENELDYPTILNNFIYIFEYVDDAFLFSNIYSEDNIGVFEKTIAPDEPNYYFMGNAALQLLHINIAQIKLYNTLLYSKGISIEGVIDWFFMTYIPTEFGLPTITVAMPSKSTSYSEKCVLLSPIIDSILKQFNLLITEGEIDLELLEIESNSKKINDISSFLNKKYAYSNSNECVYTMYLLYSNQSSLLYTDKTEEKYMSLPHMLLNENMFFDDFLPFQQKDLIFLMNEGFINMTETGQLEINNVEAVYILKSLYNKKVVSCYDYASKCIEGFNFLEEKKYIAYKSSFLSTPEANYYNFILIKGAYRNSMEIRNKYVHGIQSVVGTEGEHETNYYTMLHILILLVIKINHELCHKAKPSFN